MSKNDEPIWVRRAQLQDASDAEAYRHLLDAYASDPMGQGRRLTEGHLQKVTRDLNEHPNAWTYLAGKGPFACAFATCFCGYSTFRGQPLMNIHDVAVLADFRGLGIGRSLLRFITDDARRMGCCKVTLEVREDNPIASALYLSEGFGASNCDGSDAIQYLFLEKSLPPNDPHLV